ncbi:hypothetical protein N7517_008878 [Penicillium concentricum]|uniref:BTB domain-containing protein n=1 Tax=Penicillium concentricum TaxID=293559 RepID=A0A9W9RT60_9EURO|nr:uncharacterized protein N7517_008878 [Penicillium concentricum]KAJ5365992.1 hypothetical protein N7517_008878 [Penicillium concentricum]
MPSHHHCDPHAGLPRVWLGWGELGNRKAQLQTQQDEYFDSHAPDFRLRHPGNRQRSWDVHLDVIRKSTRWIDWRIHKTGDTQRLVLPDLVRLEQIDSLLNFFYTGDYSVDEGDLNHYSISACPGGCVTCPQICQLLRIHLSMFQTALLLRIADLQAIAFRRFRDLMDTAPSFVLQYAVHAVYSRQPIPDGSNNFQITDLKSVSDYRPELVLPAVLRYCGYYRMNPQHITRHGKKVRVFGEAEFAELRKKSPKFSGDLALGIWLDTIDITVPTIQFPGNSEPIMSMHPYMQITLPPQVVNRKRSNYQYVTYLQPLPFKDFSDQRPSNTPSWNPSPETTSTGFFATSRTSSQRSSQRTQTSASFNQGRQASMKQIPDFPHLTAEQTKDFSFLEDDLLDTTMDQINAQLLQEYSAGPADLNNIDWTQTMDWSGADIPDIDFSGLLNDDTMGEPDVNASDLTQAMNWTDEDLANVDFIQFLNDDSLDMNMDLDIPEQNTFDLTGLPDLTSVDLANPTTVDLPDLPSFDLPDLPSCDLPEMNSFDAELNDFDMAGLPEIDFSGLTQQTMDEFLNQPQYMPFFPVGMDTCVDVPQEITFAPEPLNPKQMGTHPVASSLRYPQPIQTALLPAQAPAEGKAVQSAKRKSRASASRPRQDSTQTRYNLRSRPSVNDLTEKL